MKRRIFIKSALGSAIAASVAGRFSYSSADQLSTSKMPPVNAVEGNGGTTTLDPAVVRELREALYGRLLLRQDAGYETARHVRNPGIDKYPALIVQVSGVADARTAVNFARTHGLLLAVKCGGHSYSGQATCDGGMMIDLSAMRGVRVDPGAEKARVAGGSLLGLVDHETMSHGLVAPFGTVSHTGVGGLTTGGGFGRLSRRFGLSCDNVAAVDVVTADGQLRHASAQENPDLYWGVRGGGGNFGVVTSFEFKLHRMQREVISGTMTFPAGRIVDVLKLYADYGSEAPDELYLDGFVSSAGEGSVGLSFCYSGDAKSAERVLQPLRQLGKPLAEQRKNTDYVAVQRSGDERETSDDGRVRLGRYMKSGFLQRIDARLIEAIAEGIRSKQLPGIYFQHAGGAISRIGNDATAFAHRYATFNMLMGASWKLEEDSALHIAQAQKNWEGLQKYAGGFYVNDMGGDETAKVVNANYGANYPRLLKIKSKYDPGNLFRLNANIKPT